MFLKFFPFHFLAYLLALVGVLNAKPTTFQDEGSHEFGIRGSLEVDKRAPPVTVKMKQLIAGNSNYGYVGQMPGGIFYTKAQALVYATEGYKQVLQTTNRGDKDADGRFKYTLIVSCLFSTNQPFSLGSNPFGGSLVGSQLPLSADAPNWWSLVRNRKDKDGNQRNIHHAEDVTMYWKEKIKR